MSRTVAGLFTDRRAAQRAIVDLEAAGFDHRRIAFSRQASRTAFLPLRFRTISAENGAILGAIVLGALAALIGWAANVTSFGPPGSGLLVFVAITLIGGMLGWLIGGLVFAGAPSEESPFLYQRYDDASYMLRVQAGGREAVARHILVRNGGKDLTSNRRRFPIPQRVRRRTPTPAA